MARKYTVALILLSLIFICGCETVKGAAEGFKKDWQSAQKVDDWMRKNLW